MDIKLQIKRVLELRDFLNEKTFRDVLASVYGSYYKEEMFKGNERLNRSKLLRKVNTSLRELECSEVPYSFFRS